ncbi:MULTISPECIES: ImmA/IrrE family metallo-endopeptidase [unclassified Oceanispirochaeta]|uniref:ImmA/IrrE family metallo-endopeptidase n=1 Tax=unclassified Oceanispirochaeta TaxID=2635722 RepID=UPI000E09CD4B|nr:MULTISPECIES: ImmA/IrrE family metallo-endopeptidase [unclassified Oceanispirochaeta]MBF9018970.1 ImmA/IrrE family metallo-endopeptidase [Oceanispirochaeta sp. M2]NPD75470.1 ImmA/IrrE family metallo-endopeptidase [Oceanispirochaeta sp. M1]RDG28680.1 ImmA/IrrE family metallo-endopeptidase [Oceanispirochaeta sp. M1]
MPSINQLKPAQIVAPGDIVKRFLDVRSWTQEDLADITELSMKSINQIINRKQGISVETARLFSRAFENSPEFWLNLENQYRLALSREIKKEQSAGIKAKIRQYMPVLEIQKNGWIDVHEKTAEGYRESYQEIWDTNKKPDFSEYKDEKNYCARQNKEDDVYTQNYSITWYKIALNRSNQISCSPYDYRGLQEIQKNYSQYTNSPSGITLIMENLHKIGVKFLYQKHLSKTYLDGACFYSGENPVIVYTCRYDREDNFWFTMAHEIAHVLNHFTEEKSLYILDNLDEHSSLDREKEADKIASDMLKIEEILKLGHPHSNYFSERNLLEISEKTGIGSAVVLGTLQYHGFVDYRSRLNRYKSKIRQIFEA